MVELVAILVVSVLAVRRSAPTAVRPAPASLVLPPVEAPTPPRRLARGSIAQPATPLPQAVPRPRPVLRPSHARR